MNTNQTQTRDFLTPESLALVRTIAQLGSMAAAARKLDLVPSAVTYRVRQMEQALDVLLFDRSARQARLTPAGDLLLRDGERVLQELDAVAERVKRVATGWEPQLRLAVDTLIDEQTLLELIQAFYNSQPGGLPPPTRIRTQTEVLSGTWHALLDGQVDLAIGVSTEAAEAGIAVKPLGEVAFVFAVAPQHPLASAPEPLSDALIQQHRIVAVADSTQRRDTITLGILPGQDVLTVSDMRSKINAQIMGLGCGFLPLQSIAAALASGQLIAKTTERSDRNPRLGYAWRNTHRAELGNALTWWLDQLSQPTTRAALLDRGRQPGALLESTLRV